MSRSVQDMLKECPRYARGMPEISPRYALDISPMNILTTDLGTELDNPEPTRQ